VAQPTLDTFTRAYLIAALWTEDPNPGQGEYQEHDEWTIANIDPQWRERAIADCRAFQLAAVDTSQVCTDCSRFPNRCDHIGLFDGREREAGIDFWLTRNGHGAGFWDGYWPEPNATILTDAAHAFGETYLEMAFEYKR